MTYLQKSSRRSALIGQKLSTEPVGVQPMRLTPRGPPGHASRKAWRYSDEIQRLRREGYSHEAIRLALLDVGVAVSLSTVQREVRRSIRSGSRQTTSPAETAPASDEVRGAEEPTPEVEDLVAMLDELFQSPAKLPIDERASNEAQRANQQRSFSSWLMGLLQGGRRPG